MDKITRKVGEFANNITTISKSTGVSTNEIDEDFYLRKTKDLHLHSSTFWKKFGYNTLLDSILSVEGINSKKRTNFR